MSVSYLSSPVANTATTILANTAGIFSTMNIGSLGLVRSGVSVGIARTNNYNAARNHFTEFLKFTDLMSSEFEGTLEEWLATLEEPNAICDVEIVQQFATYLEKYARKSTDNKPLAKGTIMGILLGTAPDIVGIVFMSLAGGSFIYVACSELIVEEFSTPGKKWLKLLAFCLGAIFVGLLLLLE